MRLSSVASLWLAAAASANTVSYDWDVTWVNASPDGFARPVIGINNQWPCPGIRATVGDTVVVKLNNKLGNQTTGMHFHGINQINTDFMDGPSGATQCPVPPGSSITYSFVVDEPGTFWYHSHNMGQYPDGLRGTLIVDDPNDPYKGKYDEEVIVTLSDWYHSQSLDLVRNMITTSNVQFLPPFPDNLIVNEGAGSKVTFDKTKTYRFRFISFAAFASVMLHFDSHSMFVIMNDASYITQNEVYQLRIAPAQRYDVLIKGSDRDRRNYPFLMSLDMNRDWANDPPERVAWPFNQTGYLVTDPAAPLTPESVDKWRPADDSKFDPLIPTPMFGPVTKTITLNFNFCRDVNNLPRACFNNETYIGQKVPTLYSVASLGQDNTNPIAYGAVMPHILSKGDVVDIVVNNLDAAIHPFHMHGHQFQVLQRPGSNSGVYKGSGRQFKVIPPRRDTVSIFANSFAVIRIKVEYPGVFLFHCHIEWHVEMGLTITLIQAPELLRGFQFPQDHLDNCQKLGTPTTGNAAGNSNATDTTGFNTTPPVVYNGAEYTPPPNKFRPRQVRNMS